ncbi:MAG: response regulator [Alphaproteobacteria bacterium]|nr:response regulator [Alphaproteobacteria bacterium]
MVAATPAGPGIHAPEAIQPVGVLLAFAGPEPRLDRCSANAPDLLGLPLADLAGRTPAELLGAEIAAAIAATPPLPRGATLLRHHFADRGGALHSVQFFASGDHLVLEIEPETESAEDVFALLSRTQAAIETLRTIPRGQCMAAGLARLCRDITGYDRAVVFRFDVDWNRDVIAEDRSDVLPGSFLGLRVPADALPAVAREIYLQAGMRPVPDVDLAPIPIVALGAAGSDRPLDLTHSTLRRTPVEHADHLRGMGVRASLTMAIEDAGRIWGLVSAHHALPRPLSAARRAACRLLVASVASLLAARADGTQEQATAEMTLRIARAASEILNRQGGGRAALAAFAEALAAATRSSSVLIHAGALKVVAGNSPDVAVIDRILAAVRGHARGGITTIESLAAIDPALAAVREIASAVAAIDLPLDGGVLLLLRGEIPEEIIWSTGPTGPVSDAGPPWAHAILSRGTEGGRAGSSHRVERTRGVARGWPGAVLPALEVARQAVLDILRVFAEREAHEALRKREIELRTIYEGVDEGIALVDAAGRVVSCNRRFAVLLGCEGEPLAGRAVDDLIEVTEPQGVDRMLDVDHAKGRPRPEAARTRPIEIRATATGQGEEAVHAVVVRDIARRELFERELVSAREAAERASRAKDEFLANMSHELRTPLTAVLGYIDLLDQQLRDPVQRKWIATIRRSGWSLLRLLSDIVDFARMDAGEIRLEYGVFDPVAKANSIVDLFRPTMDEKGIRAEVRIGPGVPRAVVGDAARARQILGNLVGNAVKFTREGAITIDVTAQRTDREGQIELEFAITDTGVGIAPAKLAELFERFSQADASSTRHYGGVGLGLAIARGLARRMGGDVVAESAGIGCGAVFRLRLPVRTATRAAGTTAPVARPRPGTRGAVLIIEDDPVNQELLAEMMRILGFMPEIAGDGETAVELATARDDFSAILVDVSLPGMDGMEATRRIRALDGRTAGCPIICVTALASEKDRSDALAAGADAYLTKPVRLADLRATLERATSRFAADE